VIRSLVFLNCGGQLDLTEFWFYKEAESAAQAYLIDAHRPINHANVVCERNKIFVIDDGCRSFAECPTLQDAQIFEQMQDSDDEDSYGSDNSSQSQPEQDKP